MKGGDCMSVAEALNLGINFGLFVIALLTYINK